MSGSLEWLAERPIAHRGLHDAALGRPENTMAAFIAAAAAGYAIECDLHLAADGIPVVFHDDELDRLTEESGAVAARPVADLGRIGIGGTGETIPTLDALLDAVAGRVPLLVEIKPGPQGTELAVAAALRLAAYRGRAALMSFEADLADAARRAVPDLPVGLTAEGGFRAGLRHLATLRRLQLGFVSYCVDDLPTPGPLLARRLLGIPLLCWTVRRPAQMETAKRWADQITFEGFRP